MKESGLALRSTVFSPSLVVRIASKLDRSAFSSVWFPSLGPPFDSLEMCALSLGASKNIRTGTGVIRLHEYDLRQVAQRLCTLSEASGGRFILGVGTGSRTGGAAVEQLVDLVEKQRETIHQLVSSASSANTVPVYFAALGAKMVRAGFQHGEGVLLNFCSPQYVERVIPSDIARRDGFKVACYIKLFFAREDAEARRMLIDEFLAYDSIPQYHRMFQSLGITKTLDAFREARGTDTFKSLDIPEEIEEISSTYNPSSSQVKQLTARFREAGVDLPVIYPYVAGDDEYKLRVVRRLAETR